MAENDWESLFSKARGDDDDDDDKVPDPLSSIHGEIRTDNLSKGAKKRKRKASTSLSLDPKIGWQRHLEERQDGSSSFAQTWLSWLQLKHHFCPQQGSNPCDSGWQDEQDDEQGRKILSGRHYCRSCQQSPVVHKAHVVAKHDQQDLRWLRIYCLVRNLRCVAVQAIVTKTKLQAVVCDLQKEWIRTIKQDLAPMAASLESIWAHCRTVSQWLLKLTRNQQPPPPPPTTAPATTTKMEELELFIRLIMGLDDVYYQLYYAELTGQLQRLSTTPRDVYTPHPVQHFGLFAVDAGALMDLQKELDKKSLDQKHGGIQERFGLTRKDNDDEHPLERLYHYRFLETMLLFEKSGWTSDSSTKVQIFKQLHEITDNDSHETPAPKLLMEWRNHCRDFVCHLYSYATPSLAVCRKLVDTVREQGMTSGFLELGAGTGYLASILHSLGANIEAFDLHPPSSTLRRNEWHGCTPPFFTVQSGSETILRKRNNLKRTALLLCYPPPGSNFANRALLNYTDHGGQMIVCVGEFKGLTGSPAFEGFLRNRYRCITRMPCLCWGTDASFVTVWVRRPAKQSLDTPQLDINRNEGLLLPCSYCGKKESTRRCRLLRFLSYCSKECCDQDETNRNVALQLVMIDLTEGAKRKLDFDRSSDFSRMMKS